MSETPLDDDPPDSGDYVGLLSDALAESPRSFWQTVFLQAIMNEAQEISFAIARKKPLTILCGEKRYSFHSPPENSLRPIFFEAAKLVAENTEFQMGGRPGRCAFSGIARAIWARSRRKDLRGIVTTMAGKFRLCWSALWSSRTATVTFWLKSIEPNDPTYGKAAVGESDVPRP